MERIDSLKKNVSKKKKKLIIILIIIYFYYFLKENKINFKKISVFFCMILLIAIKINQKNYPIKKSKN